MGGYTRDLTGMRFAKLVVLKKGEPYITKNNEHHTTWVCQCDCGNIKTIRANGLLTKHTLSCGCLRTENRIKAIKKHGMSKTRIYGIYLGMIDRCYDSVHCGSYHYYGGRGISICEEWDEFINFYNWAMANGYEETLTIDRIDNDGNYEPNNCRWVTMAVQESNKRTNHYIEFNGEKMTMSQCAKMNGVSINAFRYLVCNLGETPEDAIKNILYKKEHPEEFDRRRYVIYQGEKMCVADCVRKANVKRDSLIKYIGKGMTADEAVAKIRENAIKYKRRK